MPRFTRDVASRLTPPRRSATECLRAALHSLGPLYAAFGSYLASRLDILPLRECVELERLGHVGTPTPDSAVSKQLLGAGWAEEEVTSCLDQRPLLTGPLFQWHRGRLGDGREVVAKVVRPELVRQAERELELLSVVSEFRGWDDPTAEPDIGAAVADFREYLHRRLDLTEETRRFGRLRHAARDFDSIKVAAVVPHRSSRGVMVTEAMPGESLASRAGLSPFPGQGPRPEANGDVARRAYLVWLQLALTSGLCGEELSACEVLDQAGGTIMVSGGLFVDLDRNMRRTLFECLVSTVHNEPDRTCSQLIQLSEPVPSAADKDHLRFQLRQAEPFRCGGWSEAYGGERVAEQVFVQWRLARQSGYLAPPRLRSFQRGLAGVEALARRLGPEGDAMEQAMADLRMVAAAARSREELGPTRLRRNIVGMLRAVDEVAHRVDDIVTTRRPPAPVGADERRPHASWVWVAGLLTVMLGLTTVGSRLGSSGAWPERIAAASVVLLTVAYVAIVERRDRRQSSHRER